MNTTISTTCQVMSNIAIVHNMTATRAQVIAQRTENMANGIVKAAMIAELKTKLANGIAHFVFVKKSGELREAWGTTCKNIAKAKTNGRGESRENYSTTAYFDIEKGEWRSFRWETLIQVY
ncbi:MAG: SH3 beta-barrel fold-containing protein [Bacteroidales bacterium]|nr:SH3 beta-barrel fold-containing protein [Bacteroidales bacterium]